MPRSRLIRRPDAMRSCQPPYLGVAYYPEVAGEQIAADIAKMHDIGINHVRMAEFAWCRMEPQEGRYDFAWLRDAVDRFAAAGIAVVLCTPTATPPVWLSTKHLEILRRNARGQTIGHGGRRHTCPNSPLYRRYSRQIAERLVREFADHPGVVGWQIDNEFWDDCYCDTCCAAFQRWLQQRFGSIDRLNAAWLTVLWSQEYQDFSQIPLPVPDAVCSGHHPSLVRAYRHFMSDSYVSYCHEQAEILHAHTNAPVTTNAHNPVYQQIDYPALFAKLDWVCFDCYAGPKDLLRHALECDWMRPHGKPFGMAETNTTLAAGSSVWDDMVLAHARGALRAKLWLIYASGAELASFWLWRTHWAGQELEHGGVLYPWGDETANIPEVRQTARELQQHAAWLRDTKPKLADVAIHYSVAQQWNVAGSRIAAKFDYDAALAAFHRTLAHAGIARDLIDPAHAVEQYQTVFSPFLLHLPEAAQQRMQRFVEAGGTWVLGPLSACRSDENSAHRDACYGRDLEQWLGVHVRHRLPPLAVTRLAMGKQKFACQWWCDAYDGITQGRVLARYTGGALDGQPAIVERRIGRGRVILLGTLPEDRCLSELMLQACPKPRLAATPGVIVLERVDARGTPAGFIAVNTQDSRGTVRPPRGKPLALQPFDVLLRPPS